jgi:methyl coenzyme M reductase subunit C
MPKPKNEKTSPRVASIASDIMRGKKVTQEQVRSVAASVLTQTQDKKKK